MNKLFKVFLTLSVFLVLSSSGFARDWYVNGTTGLNNYPTQDGTALEPFATITYAVTQAASNDVIYVAGGITYAERVVIPTSKNNLQIIGDESPKPVLDGDGATPASTPACGFFLRSDNGRIENFIIRDFIALTSATDFTNNNEGGAGVFMQSGTSGHIFNGLEVYNCNWGIYLNETSRTSTSNCTIGDNGDGIVQDISGYAGIGIMCFTTGTTIERNHILDNTIQYCVTDGLRIGFGTFGTLTARSADQTIIEGNTISYCGTGSAGFGISVFNVANTVNIRENTITNCVNGLSIAGQCLDLSVTQNLFVDCGLITNVIVSAYNDGTNNGTENYGGVFLYDIWKNNENSFQTGYDGNFYDNAAAAVAKAGGVPTNEIMRSADKLTAGITDYMFIRPTIQSVWDNDVWTANALGVLGYNPTYSGVGSATSFIYHEADQVLYFTGTDDVEIFGENNTNPDYTKIMVSTFTVDCSGAEYGVTIASNTINFHGFEVTSPVSGDAAYTNMAILGTDANIHHNQFFAKSGLSADCMGMAIEVIEGEGLFIQNNEFSHAGNPVGTITGYTGISIALDGSEFSGPMISDNSFGGYLTNGILNGSNYTTITRNTFTTMQDFDATGAFSDGEGITAIALNSAGTMDGLTVTCNTIQGAAGTDGFNIGISVGDNTGQSFTNTEITSNVFSNCYTGIYVYSDASNLNIESNNFIGPFGTSGTNYGALVSDDLVNPLDAENNWWGNDNGPAHTTNTYNINDQGFRVVGLVDFVPWWGEVGTGTCPITSTSTNVGPVTLRYTADEGTIAEYFTSIQSAIDAANDSYNFGPAATIIWATSGTYTENLTVTNINVVANPMMLKGKRADGLNDSWVTGTAGAYVDRPIVVGASNASLVTIGNDDVTIQGFEFNIIPATNDPGFAFNIEGAPLDNLLFRYNDVLLGLNDYGFELGDGGANAWGLSNSTITYNNFNASTNTGAVWFSVGGDGGHTTGGYASNVDLTFNIINNASAHLKLSSQGNISDILFDHSTFNNTNGAIKVGGDAADFVTGSTSMTNIAVTYNTFNETSNLGEFVFLLWNDVNTAGFTALDGADFGNDLSNFLINYNQILMTGGTTYQAIDIAGTTYTYANPLFNYQGLAPVEAYGQINAQHNWWANQYGPRVEKVDLDLTSAFSFWDDASNGVLNFPVQRSSWNQSMQTVTCDNIYVDFFPWWSTTVGPDFNGPITVTQDNGTTAYYPTFFDAVYYGGTTGLLDEDTDYDIISPVAGLYNEDFGIWYNGVELRGTSDATPADVKITFSRIGAGAPETITGLFLQDAAGTLDNVNVHGITFEGPTPVAGQRSILLLANGTNVGIHHNVLNIPVTNIYQPSFGVYTNSEDGDFAPFTNSIEGLHIYNNTFTSLGSLTNAYGYTGVFLNYENTGAWTGSVTIENNTMNGTLWDGVWCSVSDVNILNNTITSPRATPSGGSGVYVEDNALAGLGIGDIVISCNTFTGDATNGSGLEYGIFFTGASPNINGAIVKNNTFIDLSVGVSVSADANNIVVNKNNFNGTGVQTDFGFDIAAIRNLDGVNTLDAEDNFFGSIYGPKHATNSFGTLATRGATVSDGVDFLPFWSDFTGNCPSDAVGTQVTPVLVFDDALHTTLIGSYASINTAVNDPSTLTTYFVWAANGLFTENVTVPTTGGDFDLSFESGGTTTIAGNMIIGNGTDITVLDNYVVTGNFTFAGIGLQSSVNLEDDDFEVQGELFNASSGTSAGPWENVVFTNGEGYFVRGAVSTSDNVNFPVHAPLVSSYPYFFPANVLINGSGITNAKIKMRVDGENPVDNFDRGELDNPIDNTWYIEGVDVNNVPLVNPDADVVFMYPEDGIPAEFSNVAGSEVDGCWDVAEVRRNAFAARWFGGEWESHRIGSPSIGGLQCKVEGVNSFSPWGIFWGYSDAPLMDKPEHAENIQFVDVGTDFIKIRVSRGTGDRFAVIVKPGEGPLDCWNCFPGDPQEYPIDGIDYQDSPYNVGHDLLDASYLFGRALGTEGAKVVYISDGDMVDANRQVKITGLDHGTKYYVQVVELNGDGTFSNFNVSNWCDAGTDPDFNGRWRMTIPIVALTFEDGTLEKHACTTWNGQYLRLADTSSGQSPWNVKYSNGSQTYDAGLVYATSPLIDAVNQSTSTTYSLVIVKDAAGRLCETTGYPELFIHTPTDYTDGNEVTVSPNPACNGAPTVTFTPNVTGTEAEYVKWTVDQGSGAVELNNAGGTLPVSGTVYSINTTTGVLTLSNVGVNANNSVFTVFYVGSEVCDQDAEVGSPQITLTVNNGPVAGSLVPVQAMPVCPSNAVVLNLSGQNATNWTWQRSVNSGGAWSDLAGLVNTTTTSYTIPSGDVTLANGNTAGANNYRYRVIVYRPGCSPETTAVWNLDVRQAPANWAGNNANITVTSRAAGTMTISWTAPSGAYNYSVQVYNGATLLYTLPASTNSLSVPLVDCGTYGFIVTAANQCGTTNTASNLQSFNSFCPTLTLTPQNTAGTAYNFGVVYVGAVSAGTYAYSITGQDLSVNVSLTLPSADFEVRWSSNNGTNWSAWGNSALSLPYAHLNTVGNDYDIQVRFAPLVVATHTGVAIVHASSPATSQSNYVSGDGQSNAPTTQASNICFANISGQNDQAITVNWTRGNGVGGLIVVVSTDQTWEALGTSAHPVGLISGNDYVVYNGTGTSVNIADLSTYGISANTNFHVRAYEYNSSGATYFYNINTASVNPNFPKWLVFTNGPTSGQDINSGTSFNVEVTAQLRNGSTYVPASAESISLGINSGSGSISSVPSSVNISSSTGRTGIVAVTWTANDGTLNAQLSASKGSCDWQTGLSNSFDIIPSTPTTQSRTMVITGFANCGGGEVDVLMRWTNGNGAHRILVVRQGQGPTTPTNGDLYYDADGDWADLSKDDLGDNYSWVVDRIDNYNPDATYYATVYNLPGNTTFYFRVFDYNGNAATLTRYNMNTASFNPISRRTPSCKVGAGEFYVDADQYIITSSDKKAYASWNTYVEQGIAGYELYRAEVDGATDEFRLVGSYNSDAELVAGVNSYVTRNYRFTDDDPSLVNGHEYIYRLVATAIDGSQFDLGDQIVKINDLTDVNGTFAISNVNPNPAVDYINFNIELSSEQNVTVEVLDITGKVVATINGKSYAAGSHNIRVALGDLANGTYILNVTAGNESAIHTFIVNK